MQASRQATGAARDITSSGRHVATPRDRRGSAHTRPTSLRAPTTYTACISHRGVLGSSPSGLMYRDRIDGGEIYSYRCREQSPDIAVCGGAIILSREDDHLAPGRIGNGAQDRRARLGERQLVLHPQIGWTGTVLSHVGWQLE